MLAGVVRPRQHCCIHDIRQIHSAVAHAGLADPAPVAQTFFMDDHLRK